MFGYVKVFEDELKIKEQRLYKYYYCELCRNMGKYSEISRFFHTYDAVFYYMLCCDDEMLYSNCENCCRKKPVLNCLSHIGDKFGTYFAAFSISLTYHKLNNDVIDGEWQKRFFRLLIKSGYKKTLKSYPNIGNIIEYNLSELVRHEREECSDYRFLSHFFGRAIADAASDILNDDIYKECKTEIMCYVSESVYLIDILDDVIKDRKHNDFNPLNLLGNGFANIDDVNELREYVLDRLTKASDLLNILPFTEKIPILQNITLFGMPLKLENAYGNYLKSLNMSNL